MLYKVRTVAALITARLFARRGRSRSLKDRYRQFAELRLFDHTPFYLSYHPDEHQDYGKYRDFDAIYNRFIRHNTSNNVADVGRLWALILNIDDVVKRGIPGAFAELGVWRGNTAAILAHFGGGRPVYLFDTFEGFDTCDLVGIDATQRKRFGDTSLELVQEVVADPHKACVYVKGHFPGSLQEEHRQAQYAVVNIDCDLKEPVAAALSFFYPRLSAGGLIFVHDYANSFWPGVKIAVDAFCQPLGLFPILMPDKSGSVALRKTIP